MTPDGLGDEERKARARASSGKYYAANREKVLAASAAYRLANPEKVRATDRKRAADPVVRAYRAAHYAANREKVIARSAAWVAANPEKVRASSAARYATSPERKRASNAAWVAANPEKDRARGAAYRLANPEKARAAYVKRTYKTAPEVLAELLALQGGVCAICRTVPAKSHVDHDHVSGAVRGLLCGPCNRGIGILGDDVQRLQYAIDYLNARKGL